MARELLSTGPHFRAADLETADRAAARMAKAVTPRALFIGAGFVMGISLATPYIEEFLNGTLIASNHLPVSALLALVFVALAINLGLNLHRLPVFVRGLFMAGYALAYWGGWLWYQVERGRAVLPGSEGDKLAAAGCVLAGVGFLAVSAFLLAGAAGHTETRRIAGALSAALIVTAGVLIVLFAGPGGKYQPASPRQIELLSVLVFLGVWAVSAWMLAVGGPLDRAECMVVLAMCMVSAAISNIGLMGYLIPVMTAPHFYATPENGWTERLHQHIAGWLCPRDVPEGGFYPVKWLYDGIGDKPIPWGVWLKPLAYWSIFTLFTYGIAFFVAAIIRRQWSDKERLPFPLAQVPLVVSEGYQAGDTLMPFFRDRLVWLGIAIPFLVHSYNSLHDFFSGIPQIPLFFKDIDRKYLSEPPWTALRPVWVLIYPSVIGITYLISLEVAFSIWFFYFVQKLMIFVAVQAGYGTSGWQYEGGSGWQSMIVNQGYGGMIAMVLLGAYMARGHLWEVTRKALSPLAPAQDVDDSVEPVSYRMAFWGFWVCLVGAGAWLYVAGMSLLVILFLMFVFVVTIVGLTRLVSEGGLFYVQSAATCPQEMLEAAVGTAPLGAKNLTVGAFIHGIYMFDLRSMVMPGIVHSFKVAGEGGVKRRHMALAVAAALIIGLIYSSVSFLHISYRVGGNRLSHWFYRTWPVVPFEHANTSIKRDMSRLTASARTVIAETNALLAEKPWVADTAQRADIQQAITELEAVLKDVETTARVRSKLRATVDTLADLSQRFGLERLKEAVRIASTEGRTPRNLYAVQRAANFIATINYPADRREAGLLALPARLDAIEAVVRRWQLEAFRGTEQLYAFQAELKSLADVLAEIALLPSERDETALALEIRALAAQAERDDEFETLKDQVNELVASRQIDRGRDLLGGLASRALGRHEDAVPLQTLRDKALAVLSMAGRVYADSAFVAARPVVVQATGYGLQPTAETVGGSSLKPQASSLIVPSGDGSVFGLEPATGEIMFKRRLGDPALIEPPVTDIDADGIPEALMVGRRGSAVLLDTARGRLLWSRKFADAFTAACGPLDWAGHKCMLLGTDNGRVLLVALKGAKRLAEFSIASEVSVTALAAAGAYVFAGYAGGAAAFEGQMADLPAGSAEPVASIAFSDFAGAAAGTDAPVALVPAGDAAVLLVTRRGVAAKWHIGEAVRTVVRNVDLGSEVLSVFALAGKGIVLHRASISVLDVGSGALVGTAALAAPAAAAAVSDGALLIAHDDGSVTRWTPDSVERLLESTARPAGAPAVAADGLLLLPDVHGTLHAFEPDGDTLWRFHLPGRRKADVYWYAGDWVRWAWTAVGAAVFSIFTMIRQRIMWWPHPIGYVFMMSSHSLRKLWFSILVGWFLKFAILRYMGFKTYYRMRGFFVGIIIGEVLAGGLWVFIDFITRTQHGWPIHIN